MEFLPICAGTHRQVEEENVQTEIERLWLQYVDKEITSDDLYESVADAVRGTCPNASNVHVVVEYRRWYLDEHDRHLNEHGAY